MDRQKWGMRIGAAAVICGLLLWAARTGLPQRVTAALTNPKTLALLVYLETGYVMRPVEPAETVAQAPTQPIAADETAAPEPTEPAVAVFRPEDADLVEVNSDCGYDTDLPALLEKPLQWNLKDDAPTVLILHTHGTESYEKTEAYTESSQYRTLDTGYNVVSVGEALAQILEAGGIRVIHDKTMYDYPSYNEAYGNARSGIRKVLEENPSISLVLDIHRDSVEQEGKQVHFAVEQNGESVAQLMLVVGTNAGGLKHPNWPENMSLAVKLHAQLEKSCPGICRPISFRKQRFNQDLSPGALILEVGSAGNTRQEALAAARIFGEAVLSLARGSGQIPPG